MKQIKESRLKNSLLNLITSLGGQLLITILRFVTRTVFINTLGKSYLGINGLFSEILTMLSLTELGIDTAINYQLYKPIAEKDDKRVRVLMKFYRQAYTAIGFVILILGLCIIPLLPILIRDYDSLEKLQINATLIFILYLFQSVSSYLFFAYRSSIMKANQKKYILDVADYAVTILANVAQILILVFFKNFVIYTASMILFNIIKNIVNAIISQKMFPQFFLKEKEKLSKNEVKDLFKDCGALFVYKLNNVVVKATDNTVISAFIGLATVGLYSNYLLFYTTINSFLDKVYSAVKASMGNLFAVSDMERKYRFFQIMNYLSVILFGMAGIGVAVCSNELIEAWIGKDYIIPQPFSILIGIEIFFHGLKINLGQIRNVSGVFRQMWIRPILGVIINLTVSIIMVNICGIYGVIIGTISADILANFMVDPKVIHKYTFDNYRPVSDYYKKNGLYLFFLMIVFLFDRLVCSILVFDNKWLSVIIHAIIVVVSVPLVFSLLFSKTHESKYLIDLVKRMIGKSNTKKRHSQN